jgi:hypothetical protein
MCCGPTDSRAGNLALKGWDAATHSQFDRIYKRNKEKWEDILGCADAELQFQAQRQWRRSMQGQSAAKEGWW